MSRRGRHGMVDRFRGRLVWPIRNQSGEILGFGARRLFSDDPLQAKYVNTPETVLYKKSRVLFGIEHARRQIASSHRVVVVEGYTDVMAMHTAGVTTAVAACGTAFGDHHIGVLRRVMLDDSPWRAEVVYMFDGDRAGIAAATKAFQHAVSMPGRSSVAIVPGGHDPCELRQHAGDAGLRDLLASRRSLVEFVLRGAVSEFDLTTVDGRIAAVGQARVLLGRIPDPVMRAEYGRQVAGWCGTEPDAVLTAANDLHARNNAAQPAAEAVDSQSVRLQRTVLHAALHHPSVASASGFDAIPADVFSDPSCARLRKAIVDTGGVAAAAADPRAWVSGLIARLGDDRQLAAELTVLPFPVAKPDAEQYIQTAVTRLHSKHLTDRIEHTQSQLNSTGPEDDSDRRRQLNNDLSALERQRGDLLARPPTTSQTQARGSPAVADPKIGPGAPRTGARRFMTPPVATRTRGPRL
ncbi:toprim domain-containing protein [Nocardia terpenica]|uniref:DNA primase n=1 Tax=Nocardia terpenica TaxID=455432 RepID=UPI003D1606EF